MPGDRRRLTTKMRREGGIPPVLESVVADLNDIADVVGIKPVSALTYSA